MRGDAGEIAREAGECSARTDSAHNRVDGAAGLLPDFGTGCLLVGQGVGGVVELVDVKAIGRFAVQALGHVLVVLRMATTDVGSGDDDVGA